RVQGGRVHVGNTEIASTEHTHPDAHSAAVYVRPHELEVSPAPPEGPSLRARVLHVNPTGSIVRVQLQSDESAELIQVDLSVDQFRKLSWKSGDEVFVTPRRARVFVSDYVI